MRLSLGNQEILTVMRNKRHTFGERNHSGVWRFFYYWEPIRYSLVIMSIPPIYGIYPYLVRGRECSSPEPGLWMRFGGNGLKINSYYVK